MTTVRVTGPAYFDVLQAGSILTVAVAASSSARVQRTTPGGSAMAVLVSASQTRLFGPYQQDQNFRVDAISGSCTATESVSDQALVGLPIIVSASRDLNASDSGQTLECTATVTLTVPAALPAGFQCAVIPSGTTSIASGGGALLNGATSTLTRAAASNAAFAIIGRASAADSYVVTGS